MRERVFAVWGGVEIRFEACDQRNLRDPVHSDLNSTKTHNLRTSPSVEHGGGQGGTEETMYGHCYGRVYTESSGYGTSLLASARTHRHTVIRAYMIVRIANEYRCHITSRAQTARVVLACNRESQRPATRTT